jgi:hypothetical protein
MSKATRQSLMTQLMNEHGIRGVSDYAEQIVAEALEGSRETNRITKGYDLVSPHYGRVEVKFRQLPANGRLEERVSLSDAKEGAFDHLAIVIVDAGFTVKGAVLAPFHEAWRIVNANPYNRISYSQACACPDAIDITAKAAQASVS